MTLGERIKQILNERNLKQVAFAKDLGISANYVNLLVNNKKTVISDTLAKLIEETYGYSAHWVMTGEGEEVIETPLTAVKVELLKKIQKMSDEEIIAMLAFANYLVNLKRDFQGGSKGENE